MGLNGQIDYLADERLSPQFNVSAMTIFLLGGKDSAEKIALWSKMIAEDPVFSKEGKLNLSRPEMFKRALAISKHIFKRTHELGLSRKDASAFRFLVGETVPTDLTEVMFIPAIEGQMTDEQQAKWLPLALSYAIIGCYAQTELGHGSNVQGLETTATFDKSTDEFVLNSPTLTSTKWWAGGLGKTATHGVVYARLITEGKDYGVHGFLVPLRSLEDHNPLPGITVGDIGVKFGLGAYNTMDNGFLRFDHVRIPRDYMLMRYARVDRDGNYSKPPHSKLSYGAMVHVRAGIVVEAGYYLSKAVTIATRYSAVRRQFGGSEGQPETKVIEYKTQQHRLFRLLATAYAFRFSGAWMNRLYGEVTEKLRAGDYSILPEVHASTAGLKSVCTTGTADGIEECRKLCGGHGYLCASGLPEMYATYVPACTYEGDNTILLLQVARYLVKVFGQMKSGSMPSGEAAYLADYEQLIASPCPASQALDFLDLSLQLEAFSARAARLAVATATRIAISDNPEQAYANLSVELSRAARAYCQRIIVAKFIDAVGTAEVQEDWTVGKQLRLLCSLYALTLMETEMGDFLECGYINPAQALMVRDQVVLLLDQIRPNAIPLVDAFGFSDHFLGSALGRYDGDCYTELYDKAQKEPLNATDVIDGYKEYLRPLVKQEVLKPENRPTLGLSKL